jgi:hypothetical protein
LTPVAREVGRDVVAGMNRQLATLTIFGVFLSAALVVSCGSDDQGLSITDFRDQANAICAKGNQDIGEAVGAVFGSDSPTPESMQAALDTIVSVSRQQLDDIEALAPPSAIKDDVKEMIAEGRSATDTAEGQGLGFFESDDDPWARTGELAVGLGLNACSGE